MEPTRSPWSTVPETRSGDTNPADGQPDGQPDGPVSAAMRDIAAADAKIAEARRAAAAATPAGRVAAAKAAGAATVEAVVVWMRPDGSLASPYTAMLTVPFPTQSTLDSLAEELGRHFRQVAGAHEIRVGAFAAEGPDEPWLIAYCNAAPAPAASG